MSHSRRVALLVATVFAFSARAQSPDGPVEPPAAAPAERAAQATLLPPLELDDDALWASEMSGVKPLQGSVSLRTREGVIVTVMPRRDHYIVSLDEAANETQRDSYAPLGEPWLSDIDGDGADDLVVPMLAPAIRGATGADVFDLSGSRAYLMMRSSGSCNAADTADVCAGEFTRRFGIEAALDSLAWMNTADDIQDEDEWLSFSRGLPSANAALKGALLGERISRRRVEADADPSSAPALEALDSALAAREIFAGSNESAASFD